MPTMIMMAMRIAVARCSAPKRRHREPLGLRSDCVRSPHPPLLFGFSFRRYQIPHPRAKRRKLLQPLRVHSAIRAGKRRDKNLIFPILYIAVPALDHPKSIGFGVSRGGASGTAE